MHCISRWVVGIKFTVYIYIYIYTRTHILVYRSFSLTSLPVTSGRHIGGGLLACCWLTRSLCYLIKKCMYYYKKIFSLIKPLEHFKIFTFYIIEKKIFDIKNWRNLRYKSDKFREILKMWFHIRRIGGILAFQRRFR